MFDMHNLFLGYDSERKWHLQLFPRAGVGYNFGVSKGTPILGMGIGNTYRLNDKWELYGDVAYQMTSSGFIPASTGTGSNSNGYFEELLKTVIVEKIKNSLVVEDNKQ